MRITAMNQRKLPQKVGISCKAPYREWNAATMLCLLLITVMLGGCEYEPSEENFREVSKPDEVHLFDLSLIPEMDTMGIFRQTDFTHSVNSFGLEVKSKRFTIDGKDVYMNYDLKTFTIDPYYYTKGYHILSVEITTNSGTGSIADVAGAEGYKMEKKWVLFIDREPLIVINKSITAEGFLKLTWSKLKIPDFIKYEIGYWNNTTKVTQELLSIDSLSFVDSSYYGGSKSYEITYWFNRISPQYLGKHISVMDSFPKIRFDDVSADSVRIFWKKSEYNVQYQLVKYVQPYEMLLKWKTDTSFVDTQLALGNSVSYRLNVRPVYNKNMVKETEASSGYHRLGTFIASNWPDYDYNITERVFYTNSYDNVECYDIATLQKFGSRRVPNLSRNFFDIVKYYACAPNSSKVAVLTKDTIYVFSDKTFQTCTKMPYKSGSSIIDYFYLTNNNLIAVTSPKKLDIISVDEKKVVYTLDITDYPEFSSWASVSMSADGNYFCVVTLNGLKLYKYNGTNMQLVHSDSRQYRSSMFSVQHPGKLLLSFNSNDLLEVRNIDGFNLEKMLTLPTNRQVIRNIDPDTGYLLTTDYTYVYVVNMSNGAVLFKIKIDEVELNPLLYGNTIFSKTGYVLNIGKFLKQ